MSRPPSKRVSPLLRGRCGSGKTTPKCTVTSDPKPFLIAPSLRPILVNSRRFQRMSQNRCPLCQYRLNGPKCKACGWCDESETTPKKYQHFSTLCEAMIPVKHDPQKTLRCRTMVKRTKPWLYWDPCLCTECRQAGREATERRVTYP